MSRKHVEATSQRYLVAFSRLQTAIDDQDFNRRNQFFQRSTSVRTSSTSIPNVTRIWKNSISLQMLHYLLKHEQRFSPRTNHDCGLSQPHQLLRSTLLAYHASGLMGRGAATNLASPDYSAVRDLNARFCGNWEIHRIGNETEFVRLFMEMLG